MPNDAGDRKIPDAASVSIAAAAAASVPSSRQRQVAQPSVQSAVAQPQTVSRQMAAAQAPTTAPAAAALAPAPAPAPAAVAPVAASNAVWPQTLVSQPHSVVAPAMASPSGPTAAGPLYPPTPEWQPLLHRIPWPKVGSFAYRAVRILAIACAVWLLAMFVLIGAFAFVTPPGSALMALQGATGGDVRQRWVPIERISPKLVRAVIASEDSRFCRHWGIDPKEIAAAIRRSRGGTPRGASTISMQVAKNMFLWPSKSYIRKALEVPLTLGIEVMWSKRRIMEVYLNIVEWGPGVFGAEAAARHHFKVPAQKLSAYQASLLAVSLPNPRRRIAGRPSNHMKKVAGVVRSRMTHARRNASCVLSGK